MEEQGKVINVMEFLSSWVEILPPNYFLAFDHCEYTEEHYERFIQEELNQEEDMMQELKDVCGPHTLSIEEDKTLYHCKLLKVPTDGNALATTRNMSRIPSGKLRVLFKSTKIFSKPEPLEKSEQPQTINADVLLNVSVYETLTPNTRNHGAKVDYDFHVTGSNLLTEFRDQILCVNDLAVGGELSEIPDVPQDTTAKDLYKSGSFLIEDTFYNDMRCPENIDYSKCIRDWAKKLPNSDRQFSSKLMEETHFIDLDIVLGKPYLYVHQGDCEHVIVFTDLRVIHADDGIRSQYPLCISKRKKKRNVCCICSNLTSRWRIEGSPLCSDDPAFLCDMCFKMSHYTKDREKIGDFKAYVVIDKSLI